MVRWQTTSLGQNFHQTFTSCTCNANLLSRVSQKVPPSKRCLAVSQCRTNCFIWPQCDTVYTVGTTTYCVYILLQIRWSAALHCSHRTSGLHLNILWGKLPTIFGRSQLLSLGRERFSRGSAESILGIRKSSSQFTRHRLVYTYIGMYQYTNMVFLKKFCQIIVIHSSVYECSKHFSIHIFLQPPGGLILFGPISMYCNHFLRFTGKARQKFPSKIGYSERSKRFVHTCTLGLRPKNSALQVSVKQNVKFNDDLAHIF